MKSCAHFSHLRLIHLPLCENWSSPVHLDLLKDPLALIAYISLVIVACAGLAKMLIDLLLDTVFAHRRVLLKYFRGVTEIFDNSIN